jgi:uncharacterized protein YjbI with pentapeptide repeats
MDADLPVVRSRDELFRFLETRGAESYRPAAVIGADLSGIDLSGVVLAEFRFDRVSLRGARLVETGLQRTHIDRVDLRDAVLDRAYLTGAELRECTLAGARLRQATIHASLTRVDLEGADLTGASLAKASLWYSVLDRVVADGAQAGRMWSYCCSWKGASFRAVRAIKATLVLSRLEEAVFADADLSRTRVDRCDLTNAVFERCEGREMSIYRSRLYGVRALPSGASVDAENDGAPTDPADDPPDRPD